MLPRTLRERALAVLALLVAPAAFTQTGQTCGLLFQSPLDQSTYTSALAACQSVATAQNPNLPAGWMETCVNASINSDGASWTGSIDTMTGTGRDLGQASVTGAVTGVECPSTCNANAGKEVVVAGTSGPIHGTFPASDGCEYKSTDGTFKFVMASGTGTLQTAVGDGNQATAGSESVGPAVTAGVNTNACITSASGTFCLDLQADGQNCGTVNGDAVCLGAVLNNTCVAFASGGTACTVGPNAGGQATAPAAAQTPPAPNNGTPGQPAVAMASVVGPDGTTTNYYSAAAVKGSSTPVITAGSGPTISGNGTGAAPANQGPVSKDCAFLGTCVPGALPAIPTTNDVQTSTTTYMSAVSASPIVHAFTNISAAFPTGQCPALSIDFFGKTITATGMCKLWDTLSPVISAIFLIAYTVMGVRIIMSA